MSIVTQVKAGAITPGTYLTPVRINRSAVAVRILNQTPYFLHIYFGSDPPSTSDPNPQFHELLAPRERALLHVTGAYNQPYRDILNYQGTGFTGDVNILPDNLAGYPASAGLFNPERFIAVTAYDEMEQVPLFSSIGTEDSAVSQPRVIAVPSASQNMFTGLYTPNSVNPLTIGTLFLPAHSVSITPVIYLYAAHCIPQDNGTPFSLGYSISAVPGNAGGDAGAATILLFSEVSLTHMTTALAETSTHTDYYPHVIPAFPITVSAAVDRFNIKLTANVAITAAQLMRYNVLVDADVANTSGLYPGPIGGGDIAGVPGPVQYNPSGNTPLF